MDGVLADFASGANRLHNLPDELPLEWNWYQDHGLSDDQFWKKIHLLGDEFYRDWVPSYPWCDEVLNLVTGADEFVLMTSPSKHPAGYSGKKVWFDKHLGLPARKLIVGSEKHLLAGPDRLLIDDNADNCKRFREAGGFAFLFPQPWNAPSICDMRIPLLCRILINWK